MFPLVFRGLRNCNSVGFKWSFRTAIVIDSIIRRLFSPALSARGTRRETRERNAKNKLNRPRVTGVTSLSRNNFQSSQGSKLTSIREAINFLNYNFLRNDTMLYHFRCILKLRNCARIRGKIKKNLCIRRVFNSLFNFVAMLFVKNTIRSARVFCLEVARSMTIRYSISIF